ncbi:DUF2164 family protein [Psychrobacter sp. CAL346-MNA-CIBAN-0220]|uniref:DUF2164 family protein n=1 Tax=Psychrobacter sp. CAL346-MNA-CIBAN-0220 TaxID=3140457 RepID=UPI00331F4E92
MSKDQLITLSNDAQKMVLEKLKLYTLEEFEVDIGHLTALFLLDFIIEILGHHLYSQVIEDIEPWLYEKFTVLLEDRHNFKKDQTL